MKKEINTHIHINAAPGQVWKILTDTTGYPEWNPFVHSLSGTPEVGKKITVALPGMTFRPTVLAFTEPVEFRWLGHLFFPGLFDGEHRFFLEDNGDGTTTFHHSERFSGLLVRLFLTMLDKKTTPGFKAMNAALKERAEAIPAT